MSWLTGLCLASLLVANGDKVAFLGDSITQFGAGNEGGYVNLVLRGLKANGVEVQKIAAGVSGNKSDQMRARLERDVLSHRPNWMTLSCGVNDVGHFPPLELDDFKVNVTDILERCAAAQVKVVVMTPSLYSKGREWRQDARNARLDQYANFLRMEAVKRGLPLADVNMAQKRFLDDPDCPAAGITIDGLHMNAYGNQTMAREVLRAFGLTKEQLAACKAEWDLKVPAMLPLNTNWANWNESYKQLTVNLWELMTERAAAKGKETYDYLRERMNDRRADVDMRRAQFETLPLKLRRAVSAGLHGRVAALERIDADNAVGCESDRTLRLTAWRNERVHGQLVLWTQEPLDQVRVMVSDLTGQRGTIPSAATSVRFVRYVTASFLHGNEGGPRTAYVGDILDTVRSLPMGENTFRPVWLTLKVPADSVPDVYKGSAIVSAAGGVRLEFPIELTIQPRALPEPKDWKFFLDLWQHPWAVARYHAVTPFSPEHYALMRPLWEELASAGQKVITTTITELPWNHQNFDAYHSMVRHVKTLNGSFVRDFSLWDEYVDFCLSCGLGPQIHCYTMATWGHLVYWEDEATGDMVKAELKPGTPEHAAFWGPFLAEFEAHIKQRGLMGRVYIALDERSREELQANAELIRRHAPSLKLAMAGNKKPSEFAGITIDNYCQYIRDITPAYLDEVHSTRPSDRFTSTFYVCCHPSRPNTFVDSPLHESTWIGLFAAAKGLDGFLRWSFVNWNRDPLSDATFGLWRPGDCFLMYPGVRASLRWEMLREGIEESEKIRVLRGEGPLDSCLRGALRAIDFPSASQAGDGDTSAVVRLVQRAIQECGNYVSEDSQRHDVD